MLIPTQWEKPQTRYYFVNSTSPRRLRQTRIAAISWYISPPGIWSLIFGFEHSRPRRVDLAARRVQDAPLIS